MVSHMSATWQQLVEQGGHAFAQGNPQAGNELFNQALSAAHEAGAGDPEIGEIFFAYGLSLEKSGDTTAGNQRLNQALKTFERALGAESERASTVRAHLQQSAGPPEAPSRRAAPSPNPLSSGLKRYDKGNRAPDPTYDQVLAMRPPVKVEPIAIDTLQLIHPREKVYGIASAVITIWVYSLLAICLVGLAIVPLALLAGFITAGIHFGHLRSKGIKVSPRQFPEVYDLVDQYSTAMSMPPPEVYVVQEHGLLNAYANRLHRKDIIVIYSDVVELAYEMGEREMAFVVCHELAHIKRGHVKNAWLHMAADLVPFLGTAYSRACEYTCDRIAAAIVPDGAVFGLVCLAAGTKLYKRVNIKALYEQAEEEWGFWTWFTEIQSTHPNLMNRIRSIGLRDDALKGLK